MANAPELRAVTQELCPGKGMLTLQGIDDSNISVSYECPILPLPVTSDCSIHATVQHFSDGATRVLCPMLGKFQEPSGRPVDRLGCTLNTVSDPVRIGATRLLKQTFPNFEGTVRQISTPVCLFLKERIT